MNKSRASTTIKRIPVFCGPGVVEQVRIGRLSIHAAHILSYVVEHGKLTTGEVASRIAINCRTPRSHSAHIRVELLELAHKGLVKQDARGKVAAWLPTPEATV